MNQRVVLIVLAALIGIGALVWLYIISTRPLPGTEELQNSRNHLPEGTKLDFKYNPPTSGDHYSNWITKGFYDEPRSDGNLVHSEEHGYIIFWYNCDQKLQSFHLIPEAYAQSMPMEGGSEGSPSAKLSELPKSFSDGSCSNLKDQIKEVMKENGGHKLIAVPRINIDAPLVLTAWGRAEKFNSIDKKKIKEFVNALRDNGPESTVEP